MIMRSLSVDIAFRACRSSPKKATWAADDEGVRLGSREPQPGLGHGTTAANIDLILQITRLIRQA